MAQAIFKSWFVDFEPVKAKQQAKAAGESVELAAMMALSGKPATEIEQLPAVQRASLAETAALFPERLVESELGLIPEGWEWGKFSNLCLLNQFSWKKATAPDHVIYVDLANTKNGEILEVKEFEWSDAPSRARRILTSGDTIVGTVRPGNRSFALIPDNSTQLTGSTGFAVLTPKKTEYREFNYIALTSDENIERLSHLADGGAYPAVRPDVVPDFDLVMPSSDVMRSFHNQCSVLFDRTQQNRNESQTLAQLRDTLLPKLLSGELTIPDAMVQTEEVLS